MGLFLKVTVLYTLLSGILLTFSRSSIISFSLTFILLLILSIPNFVRGQNFKPSTLGRLIIMCILSTIVILVFQNQFQFLWRFFDTRLVLPFLDGTLMETAMSSNRASSQGYRVYAMKQILEFLSYHPLTGSNFSGMYLLFPEYGGSASTHNQYSDVFLRTGLLGFGLYLYLIVKVLSFFRQEKGVFFGFVAVLVYGLFHETFKLGQGGFIFGFLVSYQFWMRKEADGFSNSRAFLPTGRRDVLRVAKENRIRVDPRPAVKILAIAYILSAI